MFKFMGLIILFLRGNIGVESKEKDVCGMRCFVFKIRVFCSWVKLEREYDFGKEGLNSN